MRAVLIAALVASAVAGAAHAAPDHRKAPKLVVASFTGDPVKGAALYESQCTACHSLDMNRIGPAHRGVVGRKAGTEPGFDYSPALKRAKITWTPANLDRWLSGPINMIPGVRMGFSLDKAEDRHNVIAYLATQTVKKP